MQTDGWGIYFILLFVSGKVWVNNPLPFPFHWHLEKEEASGWEEAALSLKANPVATERTML